MCITLIFFATDHCEFTHQCSISTVPVMIDMETVTQPMTGECSKPCIMTKKDLVGTTDVQDVDDPFSLRKQHAGSPTTSADSKELRWTLSPNDCMTFTPSASVPDKCANHAMSPAQVSAPNQKDISNQPSMPVSLLESSSHNSSLEPPPSSESLLSPHVTTMAISDATPAVDTYAQPATVPLKTARYLPAEGGVPPVPPQPLPGVSQELGAGVSWEHAPYPVDWFVLPGAVLCFQGYPNSFYGPYSGWGMFLNMDPSRHGAPTVSLPGGDALP